MAELATIARPYAEALFKASAVSEASALVPQLQALAQVAGDSALQAFATGPRITSTQVLEVLTSAVASPLSSTLTNLLHTVIDNDRLIALPEIAEQFQTLVNAHSGIFDAIIYSAHAIESAQLVEIRQTLEKRFARKLKAHVVIEPELIGGIRVVVGDEVLDTSVKAQLEQMKAALTA